MGLYLTSEFLDIAWKQDATVSTLSVSLHECVSLWVGTCCIHATLENRLGISLFIPDEQHLVAACRLVRDKTRDKMPSRRRHPRRAPSRIRAGYRPKPTDRLALHILAPADLEPLGVEAETPATGDEHRTPHTGSARPPPEGHPAACCTCGTSHPPRLNTPSGYLSRSPQPSLPHHYATSPCSFSFMSAWLPPVGLPLGLSGMAASTSSAASSEPSRSTSAIGSRTGIRRRPARASPMVVGDTPQRSATSRWVTPATASSSVAGLTGALVRIPEVCPD